MVPTKVVVIGAGSASFGLNTLATILRGGRLHGSRFALVDRNLETLELVFRLAKQLNLEWGSKMEISAHQNHKDALDDAEFVVLAIEVSPRESLWRMDFVIPLKHGVRQPYAENGGPGGFAHAARNIGPVMEIVRDMEAICPQAWLINFTNPMTRICDAIHRFSRIRVVGLCHQILVGYSLVGLTLAKDLGIEVPPGITGSHADPLESPLRRYVAVQALVRIEIQAAGTNHFTWMVGLHDRETGKDLYPLFAERWKNQPDKFEPLTRRIFDAFGIFPIPGDEHLCEYLPWMSDPLTRPWEKYSLDLYDWETWANLREEGYRQIEKMAAGDLSAASLNEVVSEGAVEVIENIAGAGNHYHLAVNLPNQGQISNLQAGDIVETPGFISGSGVQAVAMGALPEPVAELCRRELQVVRLCVNAAVTGDRKAALQCLLLDPVIRDIESARYILDDYLAAYREFLPQF